MRNKSWFVTSAGRTKTKMKYSQNNKDQVNVNSTTRFIKVFY